MNIQNIRKLKIHLYSESDISYEYSDSVGMFTHYIIFREININVTCIYVNTKSRMHGNILLLYFIIIVFEATFKGDIDL